MPQNLCDPSRRLSGDAPRRLILVTWAPRKQKHRNPHFGKTSNGDQPQGSLLSLRFFNLLPLLLETLYLLSATNLSSCWKSPRFLVVSFLDIALFDSTVLCVKELHAELSSLFAEGFIYSTGPHQSQSPQCLNVIIATRNSITTMTS